MSTSPDSLFSSYRERMLEHVFVGELLRQMWLKGMHEVEVLRAEVDGAGYDLVLESKQVVRHVQLKARRSDGSRASVGINVKLARKPSGCVVWFDFDPKTLKLGPFFWFGNKAGERLLPQDLGEKVGRHTKGDSTGHKAEHPNIREVHRREFEELKSMSDLIARLFGDDWAEPPRDVTNATSA